MINLAKQNYHDLKTIWSSEFPLERFAKNRTMLIKYWGEYVKPLINECENRYYFDNQGMYRKNSPCTKSDVSQPIGQSIIPEIRILPSQREYSESDDCI